MKNKILLLTLSLIFFLLISSQLHAQTTELPYWHSLDLWLDEQATGQSIPRSTLPADLQVREIANRIRTVSPEYGNLFDAALEANRRNPPTNTPDANVIVLRTFSSQNASGAQDQFISKEILNIDPRVQLLHSTATDQAAMIVHDAIYKVEREHFQARSPQNTRRIVASLFRNETIPVRIPDSNGSLDLFLAAQISVGNSASTGALSGGRVGLQLSTARASEASFAGHTVSGSIGYVRDRVVGQAQWQSVVRHLFANNFHGEIAIRSDAQFQAIRILSLELGARTDSTVQGEIAGSSAIRLVVLSALTDRNNPDNGAGLQSGVRILTQHRLWRWDANNGLYLDIGAEGYLEFLRQGIRTRASGLGYSAGFQMGLIARIPPSTIRGPSGFFGIRGNLDHGQYSIEDISNLPRTNRTTIESTNIQMLLHGGVTWQ